MLLGCGEFLLVATKKLLLVATKKFAVRRAKRKPVFDVTKFKMSFSVYHPIFEYNSRVVRKMIVVIVTKLINHLKVAFTGYFSVEAGKLIKFRKMKCNFQNGHTWDIGIKDQRSSSTDNKEQGK